jgi:hypothetical protein
MRPSVPVDGAGRPSSTASSSNARGRDRRGGPAGSRLKDLDPQVLTITLSRGVPVVRIEGQVEVTQGLVAASQRSTLPLLRNSEYRFGRSATEWAGSGVRDTAYGPEAWGFESLRARAGQRPLSIMEEALTLTRC